MLKRFYTFGISTRIKPKLENLMGNQTVAGCLEHTFLKPEINLAVISQLISEAVAYQLCGVCLPPYWVKKAKRELAGTNQKLVTVVGFPLGYQKSEAKALETSSACKDGADEVDMVLNLAAFRENPKGWVKPEIAKLALICHDHGALLKVILETAYLSDTEIELACKIAQDAGADFVKTSTGFAPAGAKTEHIALMRKVVGPEMGIKASGGIKTLEQARALMAAGADRIGTSSGGEIAKAELAEKDQ